MTTSHYFDSYNQKCFVAVKIGATMALLFFLCILFCTGKVLFWIQFSLRERGLMFSIGDKVVYPGHGVAKIIRIVEKIVAGNISHFFELKFLHKDMTILVPKSNLSSIGLRRLSSNEVIDDVFEILSQPAKLCRDSVLSNWNKRSKDYQCKLRTGDLLEICRIYRDLNHLAARKELSFGEKNLLHQTEALLVEEISLVQEVVEEKAMAQLRSLFSSIKHTAAEMRAF